MRYYLILSSIMFSVGLTANATEIPRLNSLYNSWDSPVDILLDGDYAYITSIPEMLSIFDISDPGQPVLMGTLDLPHYRSTIYTIHDIDNSIIWLNSRYGHLAVDVSNPAEPERIQIFQSWGREGWSFTKYDDLIIFKGHEFIPINDRQDEYAAIFGVFDVSDINRPVRLNNDPNTLFGNCFVLHENLLYYYEYRFWDINHDQGFRVMDFSNPQEPELIYESEIDIAPLAVHEDGGILICRNYEEGAGTFIQLVDVSEPTEPTEITNITDYTGIIDIDLDGDLLSYTYAGSHFVMLDIGNPESPEVIMEITAESVNKKLSVSQDIVAFIGTDDIIEIIDIENNEESEQIGLYDFRGGITAVDVDGDYAYIVAGHRGFRILDVSDPEDPQEVGHLSGNITGCDISVENGYAYIAAKDSGLVIIDVTDPEEPQLLLKLEPQDEGSIDIVDAQDEWMYFMDSYDFYILNVSNPAQPDTVSQLQFTYPSFQIVDDVLWGSNNRNLLIYNISDRAEPQLLQEQRLLGFNHTIGSIRIEGQHLLIMDNWSVDGPMDPGYGTNLNIYDITNFRQISNIHLFVNTFGHVCSNLNNRNRQYLAKVDKEVKIYSTWDFETPVSIYSLEDISNPQQLSFKDNYAIVADYTSLSIYDCSEALTIASYQDVLKPIEFEITSTHPNPFNSTTTIGYSIPTPSNLKLKLYNLLGQQVQTIFKGHQQAGTHTVNLIATDLPSGLYFVRLEASDQVSTRKIMLVR